MKTVQGKGNRAARRIRYNGQIRLLNSILDSGAVIQTKELSEFCLRQEIKAGEAGSWGGQPDGYQQDANSNGSAIPSIEESIAILDRERAEQLGIPGWTEAYVGSCMSDVDASEDELVEALEMCK